MLLELALIVFIPVVSLVLLHRLEKVLHRPGLLFAVMGIVMAAWAVMRFDAQTRALPTLLGLQALGFLYMAWWRHRLARSSDRPASAE